MSFRDLLNNNRIIVYDGAMGTFLQRLGLKQCECPEIYNLDNQSIVEKVHTAYRDAGSDVVLTNTFGANGIKLKKYNLHNKVELINKTAVQIAKKVMDGYGFVALSVGPTGEMCQPFGTLDYEQAYEIYAEQICAGADAGVDLIHIETMTDLLELKAAVFAALDNTDLPVVATMTFEKNNRTLMGSDASTVANVIDGIGVDALGVNCSAGPSELIPIVQKMAEITNKPIIIQPNAGLPEVKNGVVNYPLTCEQMFDYVKQMINAGAQILGGCCGTGPEHIRSIKKAVEGLKPRKRNKNNKRYVSSGYNTIELDKYLLDKYVVKIVNISDNLSDIINRINQLSTVECDIIELNFEQIDRKADIIETINFIQSLVKNPLVFSNINNIDLLNQVLKIYRGRAAILVDFENDAYRVVSDRFGGHIIYR